MSSPRPGRLGAGGGARTRPPPVCGEWRMVVTSSGVMIYPQLAGQGEGGLAYTRDLQGYSPPPQAAIEKTVSGPNGGNWRQHLAPTLLLHCRILQDTLHSTPPRPYILGSGVKSGGRCGGVSGVSILLLVKLCKIALVPGPVASVSSYVIKMPLDCYY